MSASNSDVAKTCYVFRPPLRDRMRRLYDYWVLYNVTESAGMVMVYWSTSNWWASKDKGTFSLRCRCYTVSTVGIAFFHLPSPRIGLVRYDALHQLPLPPRQLRYRITKKQRSPCSSGRVYHRGRLMPLSLPLAFQSTWPAQYGLLTIWSYRSGAILARRPRKCWQLTAGA